MYQNSNFMKNYPFNFNMRLSHKITITFLLLLFLASSSRAVEREDGETNEFISSSSNWENLVTSFVSSYDQSKIFSYSYLLSMNDLKNKWGDVIVRFRIFNGLKAGKKVVIIARYLSNGSFDNNKMILFDSSPLCPLNCDYLTSKSPSEFTKPNVPTIINYNQAVTYINDFTAHLPFDNTTEITIPQVTMDFFSSNSEVNFIKLYQSLEAGARKIIVVGLDKKGNAVKGLNVAKVSHSLCPVNCY